MPTSWAPAALQAQAVAARTYAIRALAGRLSSSCACDVTTTPAARSSGAGTGEGGQGGSRWVAAVHATAPSSRAGRVVTYQGKPIDAVYFSSDGGAHREQRGRLVLRRPLPAVGPGPVERRRRQPAGQLDPHPHPGPGRRGLRPAGRRLPRPVRPHRGRQRAQRGGDLVGRAERARQRTGADQPTRVARPLARPAVQPGRRRARPPPPGGARPSPPRGRSTRRRPPPSSSPAPPRRA